MEFFVEGRSNSAKWARILLPRMIEGLNIERSRRHVQIIFDKIENNSAEESHGICMDFTEMNDTYLIVLRPNRSLNAIGLNLAHEMIHVKQMTTGTLKYAPNNNMLWRGVEYGDDVPYLDRPWEIQAFSGQELLYRRAVEAVVS